MKEKWTRDASSIIRATPRAYLLLSDFEKVGTNGYSCTTRFVDELIADANSWIANEAKLAAAQQMADAIRRYHGLQGFGPTQRRSVDAESVVGQALRDALAAFEPAPVAEPLTITVPPDTVGEIIAMLTKVAKLLEKKGGE